MLSEAAVVRILLASANSYPATEQLIRDNLPSLPLNKILSFEQGQLWVDSNRLLRHLLPESETPPPNRFVLTGDHWTITYHGHTTTLNNTMGLRYIAHLIRVQGNEIHVRDLYYAINPPESSDTDSGLSSLGSDQLGEMGLSVGDLGNAGETLTPDAKKRIQVHLRQLQEQIEEAITLGDEETQEALEKKYEAILSYLKAESGLGGHTRKASSDIERIRKAVSKRISVDIKKIITTNPDLGLHLKETLRTGTQCQYSPHPPTEWLFKPS